MPKLMVPKLPEEIIMDILSMLPAKSLARFKCASKQWRSLISSPAFAKFHLKRAKKRGNGNRVLVISNGDISIDIDAYDAGANDNNALTMRLRSSDTFPHSDPDIVGSCDGLVCMYFFCWMVVVWNPCTGDYRYLPKPDSLPKEGDLFLGFGYDSRMDDYKVIRGFLSSAVEARAQIFGLKGDAWRTIGDAWRTIENLQCGGAVESAGALSNGVLLHWLVNSENVPGKIPSIVSFDLVEEKFLEVMRLPDSILNPGCNLRLKAVGDQLHAFTFDCRLEFEVWVMKEYTGVESCWTRVVKFSNEELPGSEFPRRLVYVTRSGKVLLEIEGGHLILYNPNDDTFRQLAVERTLFEAGMYMESLVSPNQTNPTVV